MVTFMRTEFSSSMAKKLVQIRKRGTFSDFKITTNEESFDCHKLIIAIHSPTLDDMLTSESDKHKRDRQSIKLDIKTEVLAFILDYMYFGQVSFHTEHLMEMINACEYLKMKTLKEMCVDEVPAILKPDTVISWLKLANELGLEKIKGQCKKIILSCFTEVANQQDFLAMDNGEVLNFLRDAIRSDINRDDVLRAAFKWTNHDTQNRVTHLEVLLHQIQLDDCSQQAIFEVMETYGVLVISGNVNVLSLLTKAMKEKQTTSKASPMIQTSTQTLAQEKEKQIPKSKENVEHKLVVAGGNVNVLSLLTKAMKQKQTTSKASPVIQTSTQNLAEKMEKQVPKASPMVTTSTETLAQKKEKQIPKSKEYVEHKLVVAGGQVQDKINRVCWNLDHSNQFKELIKIPDGVVLGLGYSVCKTPQGFAITGGEDSDLCMMFIAAKKAWSKLHSMLTNRYTHGSICIKGMLYVLGDGPSGSKSVNILNIECDRWQHGPCLPIAVKHPKVAVSKERIYLLDQDTRKLLMLDVEGKVWRQMAALPGGGACRGVSMTAVNRQLCAAGGLGEERMCAWYNMDTNTWSMGKQPTSCHFYGLLIYHDNRLLLLGGRFNVFGSDDVEEYEPGRGSWSVCDIKMPESLRDHQGLVIDIPHNYLEASDTSN